MLGSRLRENPIDGGTAGLFTIEFGQSAGVEKVSGQSALSALFKDSFRKRAMDSRQRSPDFLQADIIMSGVAPLVRRNQQRMIRGRIYPVGNGDSHLLPFTKQEGFQWMEDSVLVHCLDCLLHASSLVDQCAKCTASALAWRARERRTELAVLSPRRSAS